ncbi:MAG TPA: ABC transporter permease [Pirellulales bacterium]|jgi:peptide/nickel transport system permease protein|nr:ABC transporter permease [Pirellulales bacterium]
MIPEPLPEPNPPLAHGAKGPLAEQGPRAEKSAGYWRETWRRFRRGKVAVLALLFVLLLFAVALFAPAIAGTKPIICKYKGSIYFPALGYFNEDWENPIFKKSPFRGIFPKGLKKDPDSWALWPLVYQDPSRRIKAKEFGDQPENQTGDLGAPNRYNWFGTNTEGIDVFAQMVHGTRISLLIGFVATGIAAAIGIPLGAVAGYFGGWIDAIISRIIEVVLCIPTLVLILALIAVLEKPNIWHVMAVIGFTSWPQIARLARAEFLKLRESEFVASARALGVGRLRIMFRHILPNALAPVLVPITFGISSAILIESGLSVLGIVTSPDMPSWGALLNEGRNSFQTMWWMIVFPGLAIFLSVLAYNLIGEGLQEATDPRLREAGK